ncbi:hypothetical protein [Allomesorhizobium alhagi]|uniref:Uncharacterized protein n=1 Tax=Mesorhizobium alhagi CCNWXJ12-2 TaxID=1107882 RepID=H0HM97_9HYPH|nr:hypothetical protein [Mesorhizobium alhagi]EHK58111.1 hypothetical protein MAXJ12_06305 [Mesorhizobium alhagi CCNWXJ12-2]
MAIIHATAGAYTALTWVRLDDLAGHATELPVLGFECGDHAPKPVTPLLMEAQAIRSADDGRVYDLLDGCAFENRGEWLAHARARANKWFEENHLATPRTRKSG